MPPEADAEGGRIGRSTGAAAAIPEIVPGDGFGPQAFFRLFPVPRETRERLEIWAALLEEWGRRINLVSPATMSRLWHRHLLDSVQWFWCRSARAPQPAAGIDLGSGAGFPGLALAIVGGISMTLVESDRRKAAFLRQVVRRTGAPVEVREARIETLAGEGRVWPLVTARALAPLDRLLKWGHPLLAGGGEVWAWKGRGWKDELTVAHRRWHLDVRAHASRTEAAARLLEIRRLRPKTEG